MKSVNDILAFVRVNFKINKFLVVGDMNTEEDLDFYELTEITQSSVTSTTAALGKSL